VHALLSQNGTGVLAELAVSAVDVTLVVKIAATHGAHRGEAVLPADGDDEPLREQGQAVKPLVDAFREPIEGNFDISLQQHLAESIGGRVEQVDLDTRIALAETAKEVGEHVSGRSYT
jgi:hypothetical protein